MYSYLKVILCIVYVSTLIVDYSNGCCCSWSGIYSRWWKPSCGCNFFGCNCHFADNDFCYWRYAGYYLLPCARETEKVFPEKACGKTNKMVYQVILKYVDIYIIFTQISNWKHQEDHHRKLINYILLQVGHNATGVTDPRKIFEDLDLNRNGLISLDEMQKSKIFLSSKSNILYIPFYNEY